MTASVINTYLLLKAPDGHLAVSLATWNGEGSYEDKHPMMAETTHGFNLTDTAFALLGLTPVAGAPSIKYRLLTLTKVYGPDGMTPMTIEDFLEAFPAVSASEGFWASLKADRERKARLVAAKTQGSAVYGAPPSGGAIPSRKEAKLARREERKALKQAKRLAARAAAAPTEPTEPTAPRRLNRTPILPNVGDDGLYTYESHDLLAAVVARRTEQGRFVNGTATVCKYVDPTTKAKRVFDGPKQLDGAVIKDVARVWITLDIDGTTWYAKVITPGATVQF